MSDADDPGSTRLNRLSTGDVHSDADLSAQISTHAAIIEPAGGALVGSLAIRLLQDEGIGPRLLFGWVKRLPIGESRSKIASSRAQTAV